MARSRPAYRRGSIVKTLSPSEVKRGYIFISQNLQKDLDTDVIDIEFDGKNLPRKKLDSWGRIHVGRDVLNDAEVERKIRISICSRKKICIESID